MLQVWRGLEEQPGEDNWHNAGCTNNNMRCVSRLEIFNSICSTYIQHVRLFWAAHLSMQRLQLFRQDSTNPRKLKPKHKRIQKAAGIEDSPAQASHDGAEADPEQGRHPLSTFQLHCIPALRSRLLRKMGTNKHILHLETLCQHLVLCSINLGRKKSAETDVLVY